MKELFLNKMENKGDLLNIINTLEVLSKDQTDLRERLEQLIRTSLFEVNGSEEVVRDIYAACEVDWWESPEALKRNKLVYSRLGWDYNNYDLSDSLTSLLYYLIEKKLDKGVLDNEKPSFIRLKTLLDNKTYNDIVKELVNSEELSQYALLVYSLGNFMPMRTNHSNVDKGIGGYLDMLDIFLLNNDEEYDWFVENSEKMFVKLEHYTVFKSVEFISELVDKADSKLEAVKLIYSLLNSRILLRASKMFLHLATDKAVKAEVEDMVKYYTREVEYLINKVNEIAAR